MLQRFYISLRREHGDDDAAPITTRQLESLIRLSQARAKMELRQVRRALLLAVSRLASLSELCCCAWWQEVTREDAEDVVAVMKEALLEAYTDEFGVVDFSRAGGMSMAKQVRALRVWHHRGAAAAGRAPHMLLGRWSLVHQVKAFVGTLNRIADKRGRASFTLMVGCAVCGLHQPTVP